MPGSDTPSDVFFILFGLQRMEIGDYHKWAIAHPSARYSAGEGDYFKHPCVLRATGRVGQLTPPEHPSHSIYVLAK